MINPLGKTYLVKLILAVTSGLLLTASFPKIGLDGCAWFALVPLLFSIRTASMKNSFWLGFLTGTVHYLTLLYWLVYTMKNYGNLSPLVSVSILLLMAAYLALYVALFSAGVALCDSKPILCVLTIPVLWVATEYLRSFILTGFPWEFIGYSQYKWLQIIQISDILGVYGVSFLTAVANTALFWGILFLGKRTWRGITVSWRPAAVSLLICLAIFMLFWFYGKLRIRFVDALISASPSADISIVQANIDQAQKWDPAFQKSTTEKYIKLSLIAKKDAPDLVIWPETATPFYYLHNSDLSERVRQGVQSTGMDFLIGSPSFMIRSDTVEYRNSAYIITPAGKVTAKYDKTHLVPFGEYVPLKKWLPFLGKMVENVGDFKSGSEGNAIPWRDLKIGVQICFEIIFPNLSRSMVSNKALLLVNITNDAWFGTTSAPYQHFSMTVFRAIENRRSLIRSANTGISGFVDPVGRIIDRTPLFKEAVMTRTVPILKASSYYTRYGDIFAKGCLLTALILLTLKLILTNKAKKVR